MNVRMAKRRWKLRTTPSEASSGVIVSNEELLNRIVLLKALQVRAFKRTLHLRTEAEEFEITPSVAFDITTASGTRPVQKLGMSFRNKGDHGNEKPSP